MTNSLSHQAKKAMNLILKPYEKIATDQYANILSQVTEEKEQFFLCLISIMIESPNSMNYSLVYISNKIQYQNEKSTKSEQDKNSNHQLQYIAPKDFLTCLPQEILVSFWTNLCNYYMETQNLQINLNMLIDLIPTFFDKKILESLLQLKDGSFLIINYMQKLMNQKLDELSEIIIENGSDEQIKLLIPFIISHESSPQIIENWLRNHIDEYNKNNNSKYELALASALSSYKCAKLLPTTIDLILVNFFNGKFSLNSSIFESFVFYTQRNVRLFDRKRFSTSEDFFMTFFSNFILIRPELFKGDIICPKMFTSMINSNIQIPPFALSLFFRHLDDFLLKYIAKQFIIKKDYINYLKRCFKKSIKTNPNSYHRKVLDYSIMALFLKTSSNDSLSYPIVIDMIGKIKTPREEFSHFVFIKIAKMFSNPTHRSAALGIIDNWKKDEISLITKLLLSVFNTQNINVLINVEETICKRGGHAITALYNLASSSEFCSEKVRKTLLVSIIQKLVSKINVEKLKPRSYMPKPLYDLISCHTKPIDLNDTLIDLNSPSRSHSRSKSKMKANTELNEQTDQPLQPPPPLPSLSPRSGSNTNADNFSPQDSPKVKSRSKSRRTGESEVNEELPQKHRTRTRTVSTSNLSALKESLPQAPLSPSKSHTRRSRHSHASEVELNPPQKEKQEGIANEDKKCKLTNIQIENFLIEIITNKSSNKVETKEVVNRILNRIDTLDRRHSRHHHGKSSRSHKHSKEKREDNNINDADQPEKQEIKSSKVDENQEQKNENVEDQVENKEEDQIKLNEVSQENEGSGLYNVVGNVMKMLFGGFGSSTSNKDEISRNRRSSLPPSQSHNTEINNIINNDNYSNANSKDKPTKVEQTAKTQQIFEEIDISSDENMAFPDEDYSSTSESGYSDLDLSNFDFEISENENLSI